MTQINSAVQVGSFLANTATLFDAVYHAHIQIAGIASHGECSRVDSIIGWAGGEALFSGWIVDNVFLIDSKKQKEFLTDSIGFECNSGDYCNSLIIIDRKCSIESGRDIIKIILIDVMDILMFKNNNLIDFNFYIIFLTLLQR